MFTAALFTLAKIQKQPTVYIYNGMLAIKKNKILPFETTWIDLESIVLSEIRQNQRLCNFTYLWNLKNRQTKLIGTEKRLMVARVGGGGWRVSKMGGDQKI